MAIKNHSINIFSCPLQGQATVQIGARGLQIFASLQLFCESKKHFPPPSTLDILFGTFIVHEYFCHVCNIVCGCCRRGAADQVRVRGLLAGAGVRGGGRDQPRAGKLRPLLHLHLQRRGQHRLVRQLHGAAHAQDHQHQVLFRAKSYPELNITT